MSLSFICIISEHLDRENSSAQLEYHCPFSDRFDEAEALIGGLQYDESNNATYVVPQVYPFVGSGLYCNSVEITPLGDYTGEGYNTAKLVVSYGPLKLLDPNGSNGLSICQVSTTVSGEMLPLPEGQFAWSDNTVLGS